MGAMKQMTIDTTAEELALLPTYMVEEWPVEEIDYLPEPTLGLSPAEKLALWGSNDTYSLYSVDDTDDLPF